MPACKLQYQAFTLHLSLYSGYAQTHSNKNKTFFLRMIGIVHENLPGVTVTRGPLQAHMIEVPTL